MTLSVRILAAVEEHIDQRREAAVQPFAAAADGADNLRTGLEGGDGRRHLAVIDVVDILVDRIGQDSGEKK